MAKLGKNITFPIYKGDGTSFHDLVLHKSTYDSVVMSLSDKITGEVYYKDNNLDVSMNEYINVKRNPDDAQETPVQYVLVNPPTIVREGMVSENGQLNGMTKYSFVFYHPMYKLGNLPFTDIAVSLNEKRSLSESREFNWIGTAIDYVAKMNKNLEGTEFVVRISENLYDQGVPSAKLTTLSNVLTFNDTMMDEALKVFYETYAIPYVVDQLPSTDSAYASGKRFLILVGLPYETIDDGQGNEFVFRFGQGVGLKNNSRTPRNNKIVTRVAGYGSEENIPYGYPQIRWFGPSDWTNTKNDPTDPTAYPIYEGIVGGALVKLIKHPFTRTHLMPTVYVETLFNKVSPYNPDGTINTDYDANTTLVDYYDATAEDDYPNPINRDAPSYESHEFADIKPQLGHETAITGATPLNDDLTPADDWDDSLDDNGEYKQSYFKISLPQLSFDLYACAAITQKMNIVMRGGACLGCTFPVQIDWDEYKKNFYRADGTFDPVPHTTEGDLHVRDITKFPNSSQGAIDVIVKKENSTFGTLMPNVYQKPMAGDEIVFTGISLPQSYIDLAQALLDDAMKQWMLENNVHYWDYPLKFDEQFLSNNTNILLQIRPNVAVTFVFADTELTLYVKQLTIKYGEKVLPQYDITLTDNVEASRNSIGQAQADITKIDSGLSRINSVVEDITRNERIKATGSSVLPVFFNGNNRPQPIDGLEVPENIRTQKNVEADGGVSAKGISDLSIGAGGGGTATSVIFDSNEEYQEVYPYIAQSGVIHLPSYPSLAGLASQSWVSQNFAVKGTENRVSAIEALIPAQATYQNQLADKAFVNSSVATATAEFQGTYDVVNDLGLTASATHAQIQSALLSAVASRQPDNNDYVFVSIPAVSSASGKYERYKFNGTSWAYEYTLNNSSFTAAQWASINSGITSDKVTSYDTHIGRTDNPHNVRKSQVGLGKVENTKLSTWVGSGYITTLGTIATGVWHGTAIADTYIASAGTWNAKQDALAFDGTYDASTNKVATKSTVTNAINTLDVSNISGFGAGKTLASLTETDGKIAATFQNISITKSQVSDFPTTWALANVTGADDLKAIEALTGTSGFLKKTAANTWALDTDVASGTALTDVSTRVGTLEGYFSSGIANNAARLSNTTKIGDTNKPVYFTANGVPAAISYTIGRNVAADEDVTAYSSATNGNISVSNHKIGISMTATSNPNADGTGLDFVDSVTQSTVGKIAVHRKSVQAASASQAGIVSTGAQTFAGHKTFNAGLTSNDHIVIANGKAIYFMEYVTSGTARPINAITYTDGNNLSFGYGAANFGYNTWLNGTEIQFRTGASTNNTLAATIDANKNLAVKGNITTEANVMADGGVSAKGISDLSIGAGGGGTATSVSVNGTTYVAQSGIITIPDYPTWGTLSGKPTLATVATSGNYNDLSNKPTIPTKSSWNYDDRYVRYDTSSQGLTSTQKANARTNIGAGTYSKPSGGIPASDLAESYYLASNPNGYISGITATMVNNALGFTLSGTSGQTYNLATISSNASNGNTAYGWGNHADAGYFASSSFTKANIKSTLGISDWALAASKPSYAFSEITGTVTNAQLAGSIANSKLASAGKFTIGSTAIELGTTYTAANFRSYLGLGGAATYGATSSVTDGGTSLVTSGGVYSYVNALLTAAMKIEGETTTAISDGSTTNPVVIGGQSVSAYKGMVVFYGSKEFVWVGTNWKELGDESSFALKTTTVSGTGYLTGGGALSSNQTIDIASSVKTKIDNGATAYGWGNHANAGYALAANLGTASTHAHGDYVTAITYDSTNRKLQQSKGGGTATNIVTFGTNAFNSTAYLPLAGGTMANTNVVTNLNAEYLGGTKKADLFSVFANDNEQVSATIGGTNKKLTIDYATKALKMKQESLTAQEFTFRNSPKTIDTDSVKFDRILGKTLAWNQKVRTISSSYWAVSGAIVSYSGNVATFKGNVQYSGFYQSSMFMAISGHKYFRSVDIKLTTGNTSINVELRNSSGSTKKGQRTKSTTDWQRVATIVSITTTENLRPYIVDLRSSGWDDVSIKDFMVTDLTLMFGSTIADAIYAAEQAHAGDGVAMFDALYNGYKAYCEPRLINNSAKAIESVGFNLWDEQWVNRQINPSTGEYNDTPHISAKNFIPVIPGETYHFYSATSEISTSNKVDIWFYLADKSYNLTNRFVSVPNDSDFTIPFGVRYIKFTMYSAYGSSDDNIYKNDICINKSDTNKNGTYEPYKRVVTELNLQEIKVKSPNIWDEEWKVGYYNDSGSFVSAANYISSQNYIDVEQDTTYNFYAPNAGTNVYWVEYDDADNFLRRRTIPKTSLYTPSADCKKIRFSISYSYASYGNDICINKSDLTFNGRYFPHGILTFNGLKSAGSVYDEITNGGRTLIRRIGSVDLGTLTWQYYDSDALIYEIDKPAGLPSTKLMANLICNKYITKTTNYQQEPSGSNYIWANDRVFSSSDRLYIRDTSIISTDVDSNHKVAKLNGVILYYEIANYETYELVEPIPMSLPSGTTERRLPDDTQDSVIAPFVADMTYGTNNGDVLTDVLANRHLINYYAGKFVSGDKLLSNGIEVVNLSDAQTLTNKTYNGLTLTKQTTGFTIAGGTTSKTLTVNKSYTLGAACAKGYTDSSSASAISTGASLVTERDVYYGLPTINGAHNYTSGTTIYAPTAAGTSGQILKSTAGTPEWINQSAITAGKATILETTRTIWGRDFNGSANVTGDMSSVGHIAMLNNKAIYIKNTSANDVNCMTLTDGNNFSIGYGVGVNGYNTHIFGQTISFYAGTVLAATIDNNKNLSVGGNTLITGGLTVSGGVSRFGAAGQCDFYFKRNTIASGTPTNYIHIPSNARLQFDLHDEDGATQYPILGLEQDRDVLVYNNLEANGGVAARGISDLSVAGGSHGEVTSIQFDPSVAYTTANPYTAQSGLVKLPAYPSWSTLSGRPTLATVATSGNYNDLSNKPTSKLAAQGGTELSLVYTGEKWNWDRKSRLGVNSTSNRSSYTLRLDLDDPVYVTYPCTNSSYAALALALPSTLVQGVMSYLMIYNNSGTTMTITLPANGTNAVIVAPDKTVTIKNGFYLEISYIYNGSHVIITWSDTLKAVN